MGGPGFRWARCIACGVGLLAATTSCGILPDEFNLSPLYRHRVDKDGDLREMDVLWPIFNYRKNEDGGWEFRVRPLYRYIEEGPRGPVGGEEDTEPGTEQQFLWPFGRVRKTKRSTFARLLPLWWYHSRENEEGTRESDWWFAILVWGGSHQDGKENYFGVLPFYADLPGWLTYKRFRTILFPLYVNLEKADTESHQFLWPLIGFGGNESGTKYWHRVLPFYSVNVNEKLFERYSILWPFFHWGQERLESNDPIFRFFFFPLFGWQTSEKVSAWTVLWPFFQKMEIAGRRYKLDILWPFFRYMTDDSERVQLKRWWIWPFYGRTTTLNTRAWSMAWPIVWVREFDDPEGIQSADWVMPFYWRVKRERRDGGDDDFLRIWPFFHNASSHRGTGNWNTLSFWPYRHYTGSGVYELYGWLWTLAGGSYTPKSSNFDTVAHLYTTSERDGRRQTSMPLLFNYESDDESGATLRLFQLIPIPLGGGAAEPAEANEDVGAGR